MGVGGTPFSFFEEEVRCSVWPTPESSQTSRSEEMGTRENVIFIPRPAVSTSSGQTILQNWKVALESGVRVTWRRGEDAAGSVSRNVTKTHHFHGGDKTGKRLDLARRGKRVALRRFCEAELWLALR